MTAYDWARQSPPALPESLPPVHRAPPRGLEGALIDGVDWVLRAAGLLDILDQVTGDADALRAAADRWLVQAHTVRATSVRLRQGAAAVADSWDGQASEAFGAFMGTCVAAVDALAADLAGTARILDRAGAAAGIAEDLVTGIVADAAEVAAAELAATVAADLLTFGLASFAGALAESATLAVFVERAVQASEALGRTLELLAQELKELKRAREAIHAAEGFAKLRELRDARGALDGLELLGTTYRVLNTTADAAVGQVTGLPLAPDGPRRFSSVVARTLGEEKDVVKAAL